MMNLRDDSEQRRLHCAVVRPEQRLEAVQMLDMMGGPVTAQQARCLIDHGSSAGLDWSQLYAASDREGRMHAAVLLMIRPGRTGLVMCSRPMTERAIGDLAFLLRYVLRSDAVRGLSLVQALIDPVDENMYRSLIDGHFVELARLSYLQRHLPVRAAEPQIPDEFEIHTYSPQNHHLFIDALERSYHQTQDCPTLHGLRETEDVLVGHRSVGLFRPEYWSVITHVNHSDIAVGTLMLNILNEGGHMELVYIGLCPSVRGKGLGDYLMQRSIWLAKKAHCSALSLAVDDANEPALQLYHRYQLKRYARKIALIAPIRCSEKRDSH